MPTSVDIKNLKINKLTEAQYDTAVQGGVIGENELSVLTDLSDTIQVATMPTASASNEGQIVQYVGATDSTYTNAYFYKCVSDGQNPATYSWTQVDVMPAGSSLPDQTGQSGKFLTTNGTDASWDNTASEFTAKRNSTYSISLQTMGLNNQLGAIIFSSGGTQYPYVFNATGIFPNFAYGTEINLGSSSIKWTKVYATKINNGADINVPTVGGKLALQIDTMPTAASSYEGVIYQFTGTTDSTYTHGHLYECVSDGQSTPTYSWTEVQLGGGSGLPSQTGNAGKFLTTDGTDASWGNRTQSLIIAGRDGVSEGGELAIKSNDMNYTSAIKFYGTDGQSKSSIMYDGSAGSASYRGLSIYLGNYISCLFNSGAVWVNSDNACSLGRSGIRWANVYTTKLNNGADINVPTTGGTLALTSDLPSTPSTMPELTVAGWSNNTQTVTVTGVTATNTVFVSPAPASASDYASAGIICTAQGTDSLTFTCTTVPTNAITVNVVIMG